MQDMSDVMLYQVSGILQTSHVKQKDIQVYVMSK